MRPFASGISMSLFCMIFAGCATVPLEESFRTIEESVKDEQGLTIQWWGVTSPKDEGAEAVSQLLAEGLTVEEATQIAVLNNTRLQAVYEQFGIARAKLVEAGLPDNPVFTGELLYKNGSMQGWDLEIAQELMSVLLIPRRRAIAKDVLEQARVEVISAIIDVAMDTRRAFLHVQADAQVVGLLNHLLLAEEAAFEMAVKMREAGVIPLSELGAAQSRYEDAKLVYSAAELDMEASRERVNRLMGLSGSASQWEAQSRLLKAPTENTFPADYEQQAIRNSLDLTAAWLDIKLAARRLRLHNIEDIFPAIEVGVGFESEEPEPGPATESDPNPRAGPRRWEVGPVLSIPIPLFNQGQPARAIGRAALRQQWDVYTAIAVELRSASRAAAHRVSAMRDMARYQENVNLKVAKHETEQALLRYNGMLIGPIHLLRQKQNEIEVEIAYVGTLLEYWLARSDIEQILMGRSIIRAPKDRPDIIGANVQRASANEEGEH